MSPAELLAAGGSVSDGTGSTSDSLLSLVLMGGGAVFVLLMVLGSSLYTRWTRARVDKSPFEDDTVEGTVAYRRYLAASAWAGGSARNWDYSVRPVLAELVELTLARRLHGVSDDVGDRARHLLGPELWALVDRRAPRTWDDSVAGASRPTLLEIVRRLESGDD